MFGIHRTQNSQNLAALFKAAQQQQNQSTVSPNAHQQAGTLREDTVELQSQRSEQRGRFTVFYDEPDSGDEMIFHLELSETPRGERQTETPSTQHTHHQQQAAEEAKTSRKRAATWGNAWHTPTSLHQPQRRNTDSALHLHHPIPIVARSRASTLVNPESPTARTPLKTIQDDDMMFAMDEF